METVWRRQAMSEQYMGKTSKWMLAVSALAAVGGVEIYVVVTLVPEWVRAMMLAPCFFASGAFSMFAVAYRKALP
jgi:hypothetical protein